VGGARAGIVSGLPSSADFAFVAGLYRSIDFL
jgi:hypothetical protein